MLRELFAKVLSEYPAASQEPIADHPLAAFIRSEFKIALGALLPSAERYKIKASAGQGNWGKVPWIATFDILVTETAQSGYYPTYLFRSDMSGFYLNLNQGVTDIKDRYKAGAKDVLRIKALDFGAQLGPLAAGYQKGPIQLGSNLPSAVELYEYGSICSVFYPKDGIPSDEILIQDYKAMLLLYGHLVDNDISMDIPELENFPIDEIEYEDTAKKRKHDRIERNRRLIAKVKQHHGYKCQICSFEFEKVYGEVGRNYIEAHHLVPLSQLKDQKVSLNPKTDFVVLCANCHRVVHRLGDVRDLDSLRSLFKKAPNN